MLIPNRESGKIETKLVSYLVLKKREAEEKSSASLFYGAFVTCQPLNQWC
jgi:hypothetical protein